MLKYFAVIALAFSVVAGSVSADLIEDINKAETLLAQGDDKKAFKAYRKLARAGHFQSQRMLATLYAEGKGTKQDWKDAYAWSVLAAETDNEEYVAYSKKLYQDMPADLRANAELDASKLMGRYGQEAQIERRERIAGREMRLKECTGSRLGCVTRTQAYDGDVPGGSDAPGAITLDGGESN